MNSLGNIKTIAKRELSAYFTSPVAYVFIVIFLLLNGFFTFMIGGFFERGEASLATALKFRVVKFITSHGDFQSAHQINHNPRHPSTTILASHPFC